MTRTGLVISRVSILPNVGATLFGAQGPDSAVECDGREVRPCSVQHTGWVACGEFCRNLDKSRPSGMYDTIRK